MPKYEVSNGAIWRSGKGGREQLTNFTARITKQLKYHDGVRTATKLQIEGEMPSDVHGEEPTKFPPIIIDAADFATLGWVADQWGMKPIIFPVSGGERDLRTAIQLESKPETVHIYTHTGWTTIDGQRCYITSSGAIGPNGLNPNVAVELPGELSRYSLPSPQASREAFQASMRLANLGPAHIMWPALLAAYRAAYGPSDFALHLSGRTGTFKSEYTSLIQSHFGAAMDARHLPGTWSSTVNALEALAYRAKDAIFAVDDFVPVGTSHQVRNLQSAADRLFRAQGNQGGRSRLTEVSSLQQAMYPRGIILSTGEDIPEGHSMRGRMFILELTPGDIEPSRLSHAQASRNLLPVAMADWVHWLSITDDRTIKVQAPAIRDNHLGIGHTRTPAMIGELCATALALAVYATDQGWLTDDQADALIEEATQAVVEQASRQVHHLEGSDPVTAFMETIRNLLASQMAHAKTRTGGVPVHAERFGWTVDEKPGQMPDYHPNGPQVAWIDSEKGELLIDPNMMPLMKRHSGGRLAITPQTLMKRLKEAGKLTRTDDARQRNTVRVVVAGSARQLLCLSLSDVMTTEADDE